MIPFAKCFLRVSFYTLQFLIYNLFISTLFMRITVVFTCICCLIVDIMNFKSIRVGKLQIIFNVN